MKLVIIESPFSGAVEDNLAYARACIRDSILRGEAPIASHLLYTQVLDDLIPSERELGIDCGLAWRHVVQGHLFYVDRGWSQGMLTARDLLRREGKSYDLRSIFANSVLGEPI